MALSPSIPTSFVPKQPVSPSKRPHSSGNNIFLVISLVIVGVAIAGSAAVFLYSSYLSGVEKSKAAQVSAAEANVSPATVEQFIRLRNRLTAADTLLNQHVELSQFFTLLESITIQNVHFSSLKIAVAADRSATIDMSGQARNFNALAAESTAFAAHKDVKSAIFSDISVGKDGTVGFTLDATLDPGIVIESTAPSTPTIVPGSTGSTTPAAPSFTTTTVQSTAAASSSPTGSTTSP